MVAQRQLLRAGYDPLISSLNALCQYDISFPAFTIYDVFDLLDILVMSTSHTSGQFFSSARIIYIQYENVSTSQDKKPTTEDQRHLKFHTATAISILFLQKSENMANF